MQKKNISARFLFSLRKLSLNVTTKMDVIIFIKRGQKFISSQKYRYDPITQLALSQVLEFKTTLDKTPNGFQSKTLMLKVNGRNPDNKQDKFQMITNIELSQIAEAGSVNKTFRVKNKTDSGSLNIDCRVELVDTQNLAKHQSSTSLEANDKESSRHSPIQKVRSMQNIPRKKQKNLVISDKTSVNQFDPDSPPAAKSRKPFVSKSSRELGTVIEENQGQSAISDKKSIALISDDNKSFKSKTENEYITSMNNLNNQTTKLKDQLKTLRSQLDEYRDKDTKSRRKIKELEQKIQLFKITEQKGEHGSEQIIKRLHQEIETKVKQIRLANEQNDKATKLRRKQEETSASLRKELGQLKLQKQKILFQYKYSNKRQLPTKDISNNPTQDIQSLKLYYQQQILELKQQIKQKTKLLTTVEPSSSPNLNVSQCFSKQCEQSKKQQQKQIKKLYKRIQQLSNKLQTKDKLLSNYQQMQDQRKNQYTKGGVHKQFQKWKAQRLVLEQQIQLLRSNSNSNFKNNKQLSNIQQELVTYKVEKQNMSKQLEGLRKNLGIISKQREKLDEKYQSIQRQLIDEKQRLIHLLNAVQEIGGMQMFDEISKFIE